MARHVSDVSGMPPQRFRTMLSLVTLVVAVVDGFHFSRHQHQTSFLSSPSVPPSLARSHRIRFDTIRLFSKFGNSRDDNDDDDDDDFPDVDIRNFTPPPMLGRGGRSAPNQRKAMATKSSSSASVHVCTNCGSEFVKWMGRCPTCREWNTLQEFKVHRSSSSSPGRPSFGGERTASRSSWLGNNSGDYENTPVRVTDVYSQVERDQSGDFDSRHRPTRLLVPNDEELNTVLGGGIMTGSLTLIGGDPGVGTSNSAILSMRKCKSHVGVASY